MKGAELIARVWQEAGVQWVFGVPSGPVLPLIEALGNSDVDYVLTANETSAGFMATVVGALTGAPGVCVATLGPGATNLATGVGAAWLDRAPVLAVTCNVPTPWLDRRVQMRIDHHALFSPISKASYALRSDNLRQVLPEALAMAVAEPPGPVHLDLPEDVSAGQVDTSVGRAMWPPIPLPEVLEGAATAVAEALAGSSRPLVVTGLSFTRSRACADLLRFIERQQVPFVSTLHAKGFLPESHPNFAGVIGRARRSDVQRFVDRADLIIAIGYDPIEINYEEWIGVLPLVHLSTETADVGPEVAVLLNAGGDLGPVIKQLAELPAFPNLWSVAQIGAHRAAFESALRPTCDGMGPHQVMDVLREVLPRDGILAYDVGAHTHQIASQWRTDLPGTCLCTNGWSSMGFGMPGAFAAKLVHPGRAVVGVVGDGCFQMTVGELALARRLQLAVPIVVLNDGWLGLIKVKQERKGYRNDGVWLGGRIAPPSHYFGVPCRPATTPDELREALRWAFDLRGPSVIEAFVDASVYSQTVYD